MRSPGCELFVTAELAPTFVRQVLKNLSLKVFQPGRHNLRQVRISQPLGGKRSGLGNVLHPRG